MLNPIKSPVTRATVWRCATLALALLMPALAVAAGDTTYTTTDNENNAGTHVADGDMDITVSRLAGNHPIEFNIDVGTLPLSAATLTLNALDVDEEQGEVDQVYFNDHLLGRLSGADGLWNATAFVVDRTYVVAGANRVRVMVDVGMAGWTVRVDWGQLLIDGGSEEHGNTSQIEITNYAIVGNVVTIDTRASVTATTAGNYRVEVAVVDPSGNTSSVLTQNFTATAGEIRQITQSPTYALNGASGVYTIQAQLFYLDPNAGNFPVQQDIATLPFNHVQNSGPTLPCIQDVNSIACLAADNDGDGLTNGQEDTLGTNRNVTDSDGDFESDFAEVGNPAAPLDTDGDGIIDALDASNVDTDSDNVPNETDAANTNPCIPNASGAACLAFDSDSDGLTNAQETTAGTNRNAGDSDGDGVNDATEVGGNVNAPLDSDADGIINALESSITDTDGDGVANQTDTANTNPCVPNANSAPCLAADSDADGLTNGQEDDAGSDRNNPDTDGDGVNDAAEVGPTPTIPTDGDGDGIPDVLEGGNDDEDGDGTPDSADTDSDNDGIPDSVESPSGTRDTDGDGIPDQRDVDTDGDSIPDALEVGPNGTTPRDTDGDGTADYLDLDSDNDGLPDRIEGNASGIDTDGDGIDDAYDVATLGGADLNLDGIADSAALADTDGDGTADLRDVDADNDGILDATEGNASGLDTDNDGIDNTFDVNFTGGADVDGDGIDDAIELPDTDGDGYADARDLDSDDDGINDVIEANLIDADLDALLDDGLTPIGTPPDSDGDGVEDYRDLDSDQDGVFDIARSGFAALDVNNDGRIDTGPDMDEDGLRDSADRAPFSFGDFTDRDSDGVPDALDQDLDNDGIPNDADGADDSDGDGIANMLDLDSDGDGLSDLLEAGGIDANGDGVLDSLTDADADGLADIVDLSRGGTALVVPDSDGDGIDNHRDLDSDGDTIPDVVEAGAPDRNGDGRFDVSADADHDGLDDALDGSFTTGRPIRFTDTDTDGKANWLDTDSDGDGFGDREEGAGDSDGDGIPDFNDKTGQLSTAVRGVGAFDAWWCFTLLAFIALRLRRRRIALATLAMCSFGSAIAADSDFASGPSGEGFYVGADIGLSWLEPEDRGSGYRVDDDQSSGFRLLAGYAFNPHWSIEAFYVDGGEAGIASLNGSIGHVGEIEYRLLGAGVEWSALDGRTGRWFPLAKIGLVQTRNSASDDRIDYDRENSIGFYIGGGAAFRVSEGWLLQGELVSYDKDELFLTVGVRKHW